MITLNKLPEHVAKGMNRPLLYWLMENRARVNYKIDLVTNPTDGNVPILNGSGELTDEGKAAPAGKFVGDIDTQTLSNKTLVSPTIADFTNAVHDHEDAAGGGKIDEDALELNDVTTHNVSITKHGFAPKAPNDGTKFLDGLAAWDTVKDSDLSLSDITTNDVTSTKHGFVPKSVNDVAKFLRGDATPVWAVPDHGSLGGLADDDHTQYLNTTRHDTATRHGDAVLFSTAWTNYGSISTIVGWSAFTSQLIYYKKLGNLVFVSFILAGTSNTTTVTFTLPYAEAANPSQRFLCRGYDNSSTYHEALGIIALSTVTITRDTSGAAWTAANNKEVSGQFFYEAAS